MRNRRLSLSSRYSLSSRGNKHYKAMENPRMAGDTRAVGHCKDTGEGQEWGRTAEGSTEEAVFAWDLEVSGSRGRKDKWNDVSKDGRQERMFSGSRVDPRMSIRQ